MTVDSQRFALYRQGLFSDCTDAQLRRLDVIVRRIAFADAEVICSEGDPAREMFVVLGGGVELMVGGTVTQSCGPGEFFGEIAMLAGRPRHASARALGDTVIGSIEAETLEDLLIDMPALARRLLHSTAKRVWTGLDSGTLRANTGH